MDQSDENRLAELREWLQKEESWSAGKLMPSDLAFVIRLLDEAVLGKKKQGRTFIDVLSLVLTALGVIIIAAWYYQLTFRK